MYSALLLAKMTLIQLAVTLIFLIEFAPEVQVRLGEFIGIKTELEKLLGRNVDLLEPEAIVNPFVLASIKRNRECVYAA